jgi:hypothetical protein
MSRLVDVREVQEHYVRWELEKEEHVDIRPSAPLASLTKPQLEALIKTLSTRRANSMHNILVGVTLEWEEASLPLRGLLAAGVHPRVDLVIRQVGNRVSEIGRIWNEGNSPYDHALKEEFRSFSGPKESAKLIAVREAGGRIWVIDGIHRGVGLAIEGQAEAICYVTRQQLQLTWGN